MNVKKKGRAVREERGRTLCALNIFQFIRVAFDVPASTCMLVRMQNSMFVH